MIALSPVEGLERDCVEAGEESITVHGGWSGPDVARTPAVVAMVEWTFGRYVCVCWCMSKCRCWHLRTI